MNFLISIFPFAAAGIIMSLLPGTRELPWYSLFGILLVWDFARFTAKEMEANNEHIESQANSSEEEK